MFSVIKHLIIVTFPLCVCQFLFKDCSMFCFVCYKGFGSWKCFCEGGKTTQSVFLSSMCKVSGYLYGSET